MRLNDNRLKRNLLRFIRIKQKGIKLGRGHNGLSMGKKVPGISLV